MKVIWKYGDGLNSTVKHAFFAESRTSAICGESPVWYGGKWNNDKVELKRRRSCKKCVRIIKVENSTL